MSQKSIYKWRSAYQTYQLLYKTTTFKISSNYPTQKFLIANYFVKYKKRPRIELEDPEYGNDRYDGYLTFVVIGEKGVYVKRIQERWIDFNPTNHKDQDMKPLLELNSSRMIVSCQMNSNETIFIVGYSNLTLEAYEIIEDPRSDAYGYKLKKTVSYDINISKNGENVGRIRSIGAVPYSDYLITSPNRFKLIKMNRRNNKIHKERAPLDTTGFVICPSATWKHNDNPHSPTRVQRKWISDHNYKIGTEPRCVLTGYSGPTNAVIDWTTMKAVAYWNTRHMGGPPGSSINIIHSIDFFGGIPSASMYVFTPSRGDQFVFLFDTITNRRIHRFIDYQNSHNKVVKWVNGTVYVSVQITGKTNAFPEGSQMIFLKIFGTTSYRVYNTFTKNMNNKVITNYAIARIFLEMGGEDELKKIPEFEDLDNLHLGYYIISNTLVVAPPAVSFGECQNSQSRGLSSTSPADEDGSMLYGRFRLCDRCISGFTRVKIKALKKHLIFNTNETITRCRKVECPASQIEGMSQVNHVHVELSIVTYKPGVIEKSVEETCLEPYVLKESEVGFANDNSCHPGYNRDYLGVCRSCVTEGADYLSNCLIFSSGLLIYEDYTMDVESYEASLYEKFIPYKGHPEDKSLSKTYKNSHFFDWKKLEQISVSIDQSGSLAVWRGQQSRGTELCYRLQNDPIDQYGYLVLPARRFRLEPMDKYPWINNTHQRLKYPNGTLNKEICVLDCKVGRYYDFKSLSCKQCGIGCAECKYYGQCSLCIAGWLPIQEAKFRKVEEGAKLGTCQVGCQKGFFRLSYQGDCEECPRGCEVCRDRTKEELLFLTDQEKMDSRGFCLICERGADGKQLKIVDSKT